MSNNIISSWSTVDVIINDLRLNELKLNSLRLGDELGKINAFKYLKILSLANCNLSILMLKNILNQCINIKQLDASCNDIKFSEKLNIHNSSLKTLALDHNLFTWYDIVNLSKCTKLKNLLLNENSLDNLTQSLPYVSQIEFLSIHLCQVSSFETIEAIANSFISLKELQIDIKNFLISPNITTAFITAQIPTLLKLNRTLVVDDREDSELLFLSKMSERSNREKFSSWNRLCKKHGAPLQPVSHSLLSRLILVSMKLTSGDIIQRHFQLTCLYFVYIGLLHS